MLLLPHSSLPFLFDYSSVKSETRGVITALAYSLLLLLLLSFSLSDPRDCIQVFPLHSTCKCFNDQFLFIVSDNKLDEYFSLEFSSFILH